MSLNINDIVTIGKRGKIEYKLLAVVGSEGKIVKLNDENDKPGLMSLDRLVFVRKPVAVKPAPKAKKAAKPAPAKSTANKPAGEKIERHRLIALRSKHATCSCGNKVESEEGTRALRDLHAEHKASA